MPGRSWTRDSVHGFRVFKPEHVPDFDLGNLPPSVAMIMPPDGGFWLVDKASGIRYRRVTMADLPKHVCWNTNGGRRSEYEDAD
jgi:hypothetical protein